MDIFLNSVLLIPMWEPGVGKMNSCNFDFECWYKDTFSSSVKENGRMPGYDVSYEEMRSLKKEAGWVVEENGGVQFNKGHGYLSPATAAPYLRLASPDGKWTLEERDDLLKHLTVWVNARAKAHGRTQEDIRKIVVDLCDF
jgi:hypothetical protein